MKQLNNTELVNINGGLSPDRQQELDEINAKLNGFPGNPEPGTIKPNDATWAILLAILCFFGQ